MAEVKEKTEAEMTREEKKAYKAKMAAGADRPVAKEGDHHKKLKSKE